MATSVDQPTCCDLTRLAAQLAALSHPKRLAIFDLLMGGVQCNCEIHAQLGLSLSLISHHMRALEEAGLVRSQRDLNDARWIYYVIEPAALGELRGVLGAFLDQTRIQPRSPACGPQGCAAGPGLCGAP